MAFRVVLVDDEAWALIYLKKLFKWNEMGFEVVAETRNPIEALDIIIRIKPDVVFTDIRMRSMSGIELMQKARESGVNCEFVIVSGFAEFSYAQQAIEYGAFQYCLKPISVDKADEILHKLIRQLNTKKNAVGIIERTQNKDESLLDLLEEGEVNQNFNKMLEYIKANLQQKLYLKELANEFYLHPNYCCRLFNKIIKKTFSEYLTDLRMKEAEMLMAQRNLSVNEISKRTGYDDYFYFNKVFKKYHGITPSEYRKVIASKKNKGET